MLKADSTRVLAGRQRMDQPPYCLDRNRQEAVPSSLQQVCAHCGWSLLGLEEPDRRRWARHGSTRWLWEREHASAAIRYVVDPQGEAMAVFQAAEA